MVEQQNNHESEEKRMGEVRQTNFRVDQDTADKFREFCAAAGMNQAQGFDHMMQVLELDRAKEAVPSRATEIEEYEMHVKAILSAYTNSLAINNDAEERVKEQFSASLESKDKTIQDLQGQIAHLKEEKDTAEKMAAGAAETAAQSMKEAAAATEKAESASQLVAEKDRTIGTLAEKLAAAEAKSEGYDALEQEKKESQEQIRTLQLTIEEEKKDHAAEMKDLQRDMERKISDAQKDAELEVVNKVAEKERELNVKMLQLERENAKLQAKIEMLEEKLQPKE